MSLNAVEESFSRAAKTYEKHSFIQKQVRDHLLSVFLSQSLGCNVAEFLPDSLYSIESGQSRKFTACLLNNGLEKFRGLCADINSILDIGSASGAGLAYLKDFFSTDSAVGIDLSLDMIKQARRLHQGEGLRFYCESATDFSHSCTYDLIFSNATFHWVADLNALFNRIKEHMHDESQLLFSVFLPGTYAELSKVLKQLLGPDFHIVSDSFRPLDAYTDALSDTFTVKHVDTQTFHSEHSSLQDLLLNIKQTGVGASANTRMWTPSLFRQVNAALLDQNEQFSVSYELAFFLLSKP